MSIRTALLCVWIICLSVIDNSQGSPPRTPDLPAFKLIDEIPDTNVTILEFQVTSDEGGLTVHPTGKFAWLFDVSCSGSDSLLQCRLFNVHFIDADEKSGGHSSFTLTLVIRDRANNLITREIQLYIADINDNAPKFENTPYKLNIPEKPFNQTGPVFTVTARDIDSNENAHITISMEPTAQSETSRKDYAETFQIDSSTGHVTLLKELDYETNNYYQFNVSAKDDGGKETFTTLIIQVLDVQDTPPFFTGSPYRTEIKENINMGQSLDIRINARDGDPVVSNIINYTITDYLDSFGGDCGNLFQISSTGIITTTGDIDRDSGIILKSNGDCKLNVTASEINQPNLTQYNETESSVIVTITVTDTDDNSPNFSQPSYNASLAENSGAGIPVTFPVPITVTDYDQGEFARVTVSLLWKNDSACDAFVPVPSVVQNTGDVTVQVANISDPALLDYEMTKTIEMKMVLKDTEHNATATIVINLEDQNDNDPEFDEPSYSFSISENPENRTRVGNVTATDKDSAKYKPLTYFLSGGSDRFYISNSTGELFTNCKPEDLDREDRATYDMTLTVKDKDKQSQSVPLTITLLDVNDNPPEFIRTVYEVYIDENREGFDTHPFLIVKATDEDEENTTNSNLSYNISDVTDDALVDNITINNDGMLFLTTPIDYERLSASGDNQKIVNMTVVATDKGGKPLSGTTTVIIIIRDVNDESPHFSLSSYSASVFESETSTIDNQTVVGPVNATDSDGSDRNSHVSYFIVGGASDRFVIDASTGDVKIQINAHLDRETTPIYNLSILAIDQGYPSKTGSTSMIITVEDVNDTPPEFKPTSYVKRIFEDFQIGTSVVQCTAEDEDLYFYLVYSIESVSARDETGSDVNDSLVQGWFNINSTDGSLLVAGHLDRELAEIVEIVVLVEDKNATLNTRQTATATVTVTIKDTNDNSPSFEKQEYNISVREDARNNTQLLIVKAYDIDVDNVITYTLKSGAKPVSSFAIDKVSGVLSKVGYIDREINDSVTLTVIANDSGTPPNTSSVQIYVEILDFNDNPPRFTGVPYVPVNITEGCFNNTHILDVNATDADENDNALITYEMTGSTKFSIDSKLGIITVNGCIDREKADRRVLVIVATDSPGDSSLQKTASTSVTVNVFDENDNSPVFEYLVYNASVREDDPLGTPVIEVNAQDADEHGSPNSQVSYTLNSSLFVIDETTGQMTTTMSLVGNVGTYSLTVIASDNGHPRLYGTANVTVTVIDVNLNAPEIMNIPDGNTIPVLECTEVRKELYHFNYTDADHGQNAEVDFQLSEFGDVPLSTVEKMFLLHPNGSLVLKSSLDVNIKSQYQFQIQAVDRGVPQLSSDKETITINVQDVNNHRPGFNVTRVHLSVKENFNHTLVGHVKAYDEDVDSVSCYYLSSTDWSDYFRIENKSGNIYTTIPLDRENVSDVTLTVTVKDCTSSLELDKYCNGTTVPALPKGWFESVEVDVNISDLDDNPPVFINRQIATGMKRDVKPGTLLDLSLKNEKYIMDRDTPANGIQAWVFENNGSIIRSANLVSEIEPASGTTDCADGIKHVFCISRNGTIVLNRYISETLSGFFVIPVKVSDRSGADTANVTIYLISNAQVLSMTIQNTKENVALIKDEILSLYSNLTGYKFVFDNLADHRKPNGEINPYSTDLYFHVVNAVTQEVLSDDKALALVDRLANTREMNEALNKYHITGVDKYVSTEEEVDDSKKTFFILIAVTIAEALLIVVIVFVSMVTKNKYKRKLKAVNTKPELEQNVDTEAMAIPGSNQYSKTFNPLLNAQINEVDVKQVVEEQDQRSMSSLGDVSFEEAVEDTFYDRIEEKEITLDMYGDDSRGSRSSEDLLGATLQLHDLRKSTEKLDRLDEAGKNANGIRGSFNPAFDSDLESTEI